MENRNKRFWIGIILLVTNQPLGWGGMIIGNALALKNHNIYISWICDICAKLGNVRTWTSTCRSTGKNLDKGILSKD